MQYLRTELVTILPLPSHS